MLNLCAKSIANMMTYKRKTKIIKGIIWGIIIGIAVGSYCSCMIQSQRKVKRKAGKAVHAVGDFIEQVPYIFK